MRNLGRTRRNRERTFTGASGRSLALLAAAAMSAGAAASADQAADPAVSAAPLIRPLSAHDDPAESPAVIGLPGIGPAMTAPAVMPPTLKAPGAQVIRPMPWRWSPQPADLDWRIDLGGAGGASAGRLALGPEVVGAAASALAPLGPIRVSAVAADLSGQSAGAWLGALDRLGAGRRDPRLMRRALPGGALSVTALGRTLTVKHDADAGVLRLHAPALGLDVAGPARTVGQAERLLRRWLDSRRDALTTLALRRSIAATPDDPLAGNAGSLLHAFTMAPLLPGGPWASGGALIHAPDVVAIEAAAGWSAATRRDPGPEGHSAPLAAQAPLGGGLTLSVAAPIGWARTETGAERGMAGLSLGLSGDVAPGWRLGALLHGGAAGETDRSLGALTGVSAVSTYALEAGGARISLHNSVSGMQSAPLAWNGRTHDPELAGVALRNGVAVDWAAPGFGHAQGRWGMEVADWRWTGTRMHRTEALEAGLGWHGRDRLGRERTALRLSGVLDDGDGPALRAGLELRF